MAELIPVLLPLLLLLAVRNLLEILLIPRRLQERPPAPGRGLLSLLLLAVCYGVAAFATIVDLARRGTPSLLLYSLGLAALVAGYAGRLAAVRQLGAAYSQSFLTDPGGRFVTAGLYRFIRHPIYTFYLLEMLAFVLVRPNWFSAAALVVVLLASLYRIRREEAELLVRFGDAYAAYRRQTRALLPYLV